ncbi:hypothetical protein D3C81_1615550 [compost metagenome]
MAIASGALNQAILPLLVQNCLTIGYLTKFIFKRKKQKVQIFVFFILRKTFGEMISLIYLKINPSKILYVYPKEAFHYWRAAD